MTAQGFCACLGDKFFKLRENPVNHVSYKGIRNFEGCRDFGNQVVSFNLSFLISVKFFPDFVYAFFSYITQDFGYLCDAFVRNPHIGAGQTCKIKTAVKYCECLASELLVDLFFINYKRVHHLFKTHTHIGFSQFLDCIVNRVSLPVSQGCPRVALVKCRHFDHFFAFVPGMVKIFLCIFFYFFWIKFHIYPLVTDYWNSDLSDP
ncbi:hypothetical protein DSECCO2_589450 [anaerobic digester metagenome]